MIRLPFIGVDMFCPNCQRLLVTFREDGLMNIAGKTDLHGSAEGQFDEDGNEMPPDALIVTHAICMRRRCIAKRWIQDHTKPRRMK